MNCVPDGQRKSGSFANDIRHAWWQLADAFFGRIRQQDTQDFTHSLAHILRHRISVCIGPLFANDDQISDVKGSY